MRDGIEATCDDGNTSCGSEVIVHLRRLAHRLRQQRETVLDASCLQPATRRVVVEERNADDGRGLERSAQSHGHVAALDLAHRHARDADAVGQLLDK